MMKKRDMESSSQRDEFVTAAHRQIAGIAFTMIVLALSLSAATYAWFSSSRFTNVTPTAHTVSDSSSDLLISLSANGPWDKECALDAADKTLYPVSTADLSSFWGATFQNPSGINTDYANYGSSASNYVLEGTFYLQCGGSSLNLFLLPEQMSVSSDPQLLAALRVGMIIESSSGSSTYIFTCDDLGSTAGAASRRTTAQSGVVVSGSGSWSYVADPAVSMSSYAADASGDDAVSARSGATPLVTLSSNEVATVRYFVYMEGCDENCIDEAQSRNLQLKFAFGATKA